MITKTLKLLLIFIWLSHFLQVFTPETGFDALWYHLPVAKAMVQQGGFVYLPELYQSVNPLFSDLIFTVGYALGGVMGAKLVAYAFGLVCLWLSTRIARFFLDEEHVLWLACMVSLIQVVAWQSASFYVDVAKACWELGAMYILAQAYEQRGISRNHLLAAGLLVGASLGTKAFSFLLIPFFMWALTGITQKKLDLAVFFTTFMIFSLPFYLRSYFYTGDAFYTLTHNFGRLAEIGQSASRVLYLLEKIVTLPYSYIKLIVARDYISPVLVALTPLLWWQRKAIQESKQLRMLLVFVGYQWLIWWFLPPSSTRYALSGFIILMVLIIWMLQKTLVAHKAIRIILTLAILLTFIPRLYVNFRSLTYLAEDQTSQEYLQQFRDGNIDQHIDAWYGASQK